MDVLQAFLYGLITAIATGFGVFPVYWASVGDRGLGILWGISAGVMVSISVLDLFAPVRNEPLYLAIGALVGVAFVLVASDRVEAFTEGRQAAQEGSGDPGDAHAEEAEHDHGPTQGGHGHAHAVKWSSLSLLMFLVFTVHSAPEGVGIGSALRTGTTTGLIVVGAIALHNIPEGTAVAVGLRADGQSVWRAFWLAIVTSLPQPLLAPLVFLVAVGPFLPAGMGFAGGAMIALVLTEVLPEGRHTHEAGFWLGAVLGVAIGIGLNVLVPVPGGL